MGETVVVYDEDEGWAWGQLQADGYVGYLPAAALGDASSEPDPRASRRCAPSSIPART